MTRRRSVFSRTPIVVSPLAYYGISQFATLTRCVCCLYHNTRSISVRHVSAALAALVVAGSMSAQQPPAKEKMAGMDHDKMMQEMDHAGGPWKELNAYHELMMAAWHPANGKNDLAPTRAKIVDMVAAAKTLAASTAPKACDAPKLKAVATSLPKDTQTVADLVAKKADDVALKAAMKALHQKFEVLEKGCEAPKKESK